MLTLLGFQIRAHDIDAHFYANAPRRIFCPDCDTLLDRSYTPNDLNLRSLSTDMAATYDNRTLVSQRFRDFCQRWKLTDIDLARVNLSPLAYLLRPRRIVTFDWERRRTRFLGYCRCCGEYEEIIGANPVYLKDLKAPLVDGIYRTDLEFASRRAKHPLDIIGIRTKDRMEEDGLTGIIYERIDS